MKIGTSNIHNAIKFTVSIAYDAYVDIFYGGLLFHRGHFVFVNKNLLVLLKTISPGCRVRGISDAIFSTASLASSMHCFPPSQQLPVLIYDVYNDLK